MSSQARRANGEFYQSTIDYPKSVDMRTGHIVIIESCLFLMYIYIADILETQRSDWLAACNLDFQVGHLGLTFGMHVCESNHYGCSVCAREMALVVVSCDIRSRRACSPVLWITAE